MKEHTRSLSDRLLLHGREDIGAFDTTLSMVAAAMRIHVCVWNDRNVMYYSRIRKLRNIKLACRTPLVYTRVEQCGSSWLTTQ